MIRKLALGFFAVALTATVLSATTATPAAAVTSRNPNVFVVGDSISSKLFFNASAGNALEAWWSLFSRKSGAKITGVSAQGGSGLIKRGNRTRAGAKCDGSTFGERLGEIKRADYLIIEGGRNDYRSCSGSSSRGLSETEQSQGIQSYVSKLAARVDALGIPRGHVVFMTPWGTNNADRRDFLQRTVAGVARKAGFLYAPTAQMSASYSYDGTHPNRAGSNRIASEVLGYLKANAGFGPIYDVCPLEPGDQYKGYICKAAPMWRGNGPILKPTGQVGVPFSFKPVVTGNPKPARFTRESGALPEWMTLNPTTGELSGLPTGSGGKTIRVRASNGFGKDAVQTITITIAPAAAGKSQSNLTPTPTPTESTPTPTPSPSPTESSPTPTTPTPTESSPTPTPSPSLTPSIG